MRLPANKPVLQFPRLAAALLLCVAGLLAMAWVTIAIAQPVKPVPPLSGRVVDLTQSLDPGQTSQLDTKLRDYEQRKGTQLAVLIVPGTQPETIERYSIRVAEQWKLGRKKVDDGAILVIARDDRTLRIEVGYGLEGVLNDATCKRIIDDLIVPHFRQGDFAGGISVGVDAMMKVIDGENLPAPQGSDMTSLPINGLAQAWPVFLVIALTVSRFARKLLGPLPGGMLIGGLLGVLTWLLLGTVFLALFAGFMGFVITLLGVGTFLRGGPPGYGGGHYGGGHYGNDGFRGGGGGFGGGGASGRW